MTEKKYGMLDKLGKRVYFCFKESIPYMSSCYLLKTKNIPNVGHFSNWVIIPTI